MEKNDIFIGKCIDYDSEGLGLVKHEGLVVFVKNLLRFEEAEIICTRVKKNYAYGRVLKLLKTSENRVEPKCDVYKFCGGCNLQHMNRIEQAYFKKNKVEACFKSIANLQVDVDECLNMDNPYRYRNKVQVPCKYTDKLRMGFYKERSNDIVEFNDCLVQSDLSNRIISFLKIELNKYDFKTSLRHVLLKHAHKSNEVMVVFISNVRLKGFASLVETLTKNFKEIKSVINNINTREDNVILGEKEELLYNKSKINEVLCGLNFNISSKSFFQINPYQTEILYNKALELANISNNEIVLDLYCGIGTIGLLASRFAKRVIGIEVVAEAIEDAKNNAKINAISNVDFYCMDAGEGARMLLEKNIEINTVIVDPPRKGLNDLAKTSIISINPEKLVYISCDASTLARDVRYFNDEGYKIERVVPVDMFPLTSHVETVVLMSRVEP